VALLLTLLLSCLDRTQRACTCKAYYLHDCQLKSRLTPSIIYCIAIAAIKTAKTRVIIIEPRLRGSVSRKYGAQSLIIYIIHSDKTNPSIFCITISMINKSYEPAVFKTNRGSLIVRTCSKPLSLCAFLRVEDLVHNFTGIQTNPLITHYPWLFAAYVVLLPVLPLLLPLVEWMWVAYGPLWYSLS